MFEELSKTELNIGRILTMSGSIFKQCIVSFFMLSLAVNLPINILTYYIYDHFDFTQMNVIMLIMQLAILFMSLLSRIGVAYIVENKVTKGEVISFTDAFNFAFRKWGNAIKISLLIMVILIGLLFLLIIPAIIVGIYFTFAIFIVVLRNKNGFEALLYSKSLVSGKWFKVFGYNLVFGLLGLALAYGVQIISQYIAINFVVQILVDTFVNFLSTYFVTCLILLFLNLDYTKSNE